MVSRPRLGISFPNTYRITGLSLNHPFIQSTFSGITWGPGPARAGPRPPGVPGRARRQLAREDEPEQDSCVRLRPAAPSCCGAAPFPSLGPRPLTVIRGLSGGDRRRRDTRAPGARLPAPAGSAAARPVVRHRRPRAPALAHPLA